MRTIIRDGITLTVADDATDAYIDACFHGAAGLAAMQAASKAPYGDVAYADPGYQSDGKKRYPLDSAAHVRAAWSYINQADNRKAYTGEQLTEIEDKIKAAGTKFDVKFASVEETAATTPPELEGITLVLPDGTRARLGSAPDTHLASLDNPTVADMTMPDDPDGDGDNDADGSLVSRVEELEAAVSSIIELLTGGQSDNEMATINAAAEAAGLEQPLPA